jgi:hypothetical protein
MAPAHSWEQTDSVVALPSIEKRNHIMVHDFAIAFGFILIVIAPVLVTLRAVSNQKDTY